MSTPGTSADYERTGARVEPSRRRSSDMPARDRSRRSRRLTTETKSSFKTTELMAYLGVFIAIVIAGAVAAGLDARRVWLYITILTVGYMVSRGLAKMGSRDPYDE